MNKSVYYTQFVQKCQLDQYYSKLVYFPGTRWRTRVPAGTRTRVPGYPGPEPGTRVRNRVPGSGIGYPGPQPGYPGREPGTRPFCCVKSQ